jgi:hypothetical protein
VGEAVKTAARTAGAIGAASLLLVVAVLAWGWFHPARTGCKTGTRVATPRAQASDIVATFNTPRLTSITSSEGTVTARGYADPKNDGDQMRTEWYEAVAGVEYIQQNGGYAAIEQKVLDSKGNVLSDEPDDAARFTDSDATIDQPKYESTAEANTQRAGGEVTVNYYPYFRGIGELVFTPANEAFFLDDYGANMNTLATGLVSQSRPLLITVMDGSCSPRLVFGSLATGTGISSMAWEADDIHVLDDDRIGRRVETPGPLPTGP